MTTTELRREESFADRLLASTLKQRAAEKTAAVARMAATPTADTAEASAAEAGSAAEEAAVEKSRLVKIIDRLATVAMLKRPFATWGKRSLFVGVGDNTGATRRRRRRRRRRRSGVCCLGVPNMSLLDIYADTRSSVLFAAVRQRVGGLLDRLRDDITRATDDDVISAYLAPPAGDNTSGETDTDDELLSAVWMRRRKKDFTPWGG